MLILKDNKLYTVGSDNNTGRLGKGIKRLEKNDNTTEVKEDLQISKEKFKWDKFYENPQSVQYINRILEEGHDRILEMQQIEARKQ